MKIEIITHELDGPGAAGLIALLMQTHGTAQEVQSLFGQAAASILNQVRIEQEPATLSPEQLAALAPAEAGVPFVPAPPAASVTDAEPTGTQPGPAAPVMVPGVPEQPTASVQLDSAGLPWDARIHAGTKTTKADGTWKRKPGVDDATVASVETELRPKPAFTAAAPPPPAPAATAVDAPAPTPPAAPAAAPPPPSTPAAPAPSAPPPPSAAEAAPQAAPAPVRFAAAVQATTAAQTAGKLTQEDALRAVQHYVPTATSVADLLAAEAVTPGVIDGYAAWVAAL